MPDVCGVERLEHSFKNWSIFSFYENIGSYNVPTSGSDVWQVYGPWIML